MSSAPQASDSGTEQQHQVRYLASDFQRLTLRRRISSPHIPSPDSALLAQEPRQSRHASYRTSTATAARAIESSNPTVLPPASHSYHSSRQGSTSSSSKGGGAVNSSFLKQCVAEDDHGVSHILFLQPPPRSSITVCYINFT